MSIIIIIIIIIMIIIVLSDTNVSLKNFEKLSKYKDLEIEVTKIGISKQHYQYLLVD